MQKQSLFLKLKVVLLIGSVLLLCDCQKTFSNVSGIHPASESGDTTGFQIPVSENDSYLRETKNILQNPFFVNALASNLSLHNNAVYTRDNLLKEVQAAWQLQNFDTLEQLLSENKGVYCSDGELLDSTYYDAFEDAAQKEQEANAVVEQKFSDWMQAYPKSTTPYLALARYYYGKGAQARGEDYIDKVSEQDRQTLADNMAKALSALDRLEKAGLKADAEFYTIKIKIFTCGGSNRKTLWETFVKGVQEDSDYLPLYDRLSTALLTRWYGNSDDLLRFAQWAAAYPHKSWYTPELVYARIAEDTAAMTAANAARSQDPQEFLNYGFSWPVIKTGMIDIANRGEMSASRLNIYCWMAVQYKDVATSKVLFNATADTRFKDIWMSDDAYQKAKAWANSAE